MPSIKLNVTNVRGCARAEIDMNRIALICGKNGVGKTSIAVSAAVAAQPSLFASNLAKDECARGSASLTFGQSTTGFKWAKKGESVSKEIVASGESWCDVDLISLGVESFVDLEKKDRAHHLIDLIRAVPSESDFIAECVDQSIEKPVIAAYWKIISVDGWDKAHERAKTKATENKGAWKEVTGEKWGINKSEGWLPKTCEPEVERGKATREDLQAVVDGARAERESLIEQMGADKSEIARARAIAAELAETTKTYAEQLDVYNGLKDDRDAAREAVEQLPDPNELPDFPCPWEECGKPLAFEDVPGGKRVIKGEGREMLSRDEVKKRGREKNDARQKAIHLEQLTIDADRAANRLATKINSCNAAVKWLEDRELPLVAEGGKDDAAAVSKDDLESSAARLDQAQKALREFETVEKANDYHKKIKIGVALTKILGPTGVRQTKLASRMNALRQRLKHFSNHISGEFDVSISDDMDVTLNARPYRNLCSSERWLVDLVIQVTLAVQAEVPFIIVDNLDHVLPIARARALELIDKAQLRALVLCATRSTSDVPNLAKLEIGKTYEVGPHGEAQEVVA